MSSESGLNQHLAVASEDARLRQRQLRGRRWGREITHFRWVINQNVHRLLLFSIPLPSFSVAQNRKIPLCLGSITPKQALNHQCVLCQCQHPPMPNHRGLLAHPCAKGNGSVLMDCAVRGKEYLRYQGISQGMSYLLSLDPFPRGSLHKKKPLRCCHYSMTLVGQCDRASKSHSGHCPCSGLAERFVFPAGTLEAPRAAQGPGHT